jgi:hypothetical protein
MRLIRIHEELNFVFIILTRYYFEQDITWNCLPEARLGMFISLLGNLESFRKDQSPNRQWFKRVLNY